MKTAGDIWHLEPAFITGFVGAALAVLVAFGVPLTDEQRLRILELAVPLYLIVGAFVVRRKVMPVKRIENAGLSPEGVKREAELRAEAPS